MGEGGEHAQLWNVEIPFFAIQLFYFIFLLNFMNWIWLGHELKYQLFKLFGVESN